MVLSAGPSGWARLGPVTDYDRERTTSGTAEFVPAPRFSQAQAWWIASELCRRNAELSTFESFPLDGFYHGLQVSSSPADSHHLFMNFLGGIHLLPADRPHERFGWDLALAAESPHEVIRRIESTMSWSRPLPSATTRRSLTYRTIAAVINSLVNDQAPWTATLFGVPSDVPAQDFQGLASAVRTPATSPITYWALRAGDETRAILHTGGWLFDRETAPLDMMAAYRKRRRVEDVLAATLNLALK